MATILSKKDFKIIWKSIKNPSKVIIELEQETLNKLMIRRWEGESIDQSLSRYILSWEINNKDNISWTYDNINDLLLSLK